MCLPRVLAYVRLCKQTRLLQCTCNQVRRSQWKSLVNSARRFIFFFFSEVMAKAHKRNWSVKHSSNEVSLTVAFVPTLTMVRVIWIPLRRAKWPPIVRAQHTGSEASLSPQCSHSNYDIIFLQDFGKSSHFTQRAWNWAGVRWWKPRPWRVSGFHCGSPKIPSGEFLRSFVLVHFPRRLEAPTQAPDAGHSFSTTGLYWWQQWGLHFPDLWSLVFCNQSERCLCHQKKDCLL